MNWAKRYNRRPQYVNISTEKQSYLRKADLSFDAIAMLTILLSEAETWQFSIKGYAAILPNSSEYQIRKALQELEEKKYLCRRRKRDNGLYIGMEYIFSDVCFSDDEIEEIKNYRDDKEIIKVIDSPKNPENKASSPCVENQHVDETLENRASSPCVKNQHVENRRQRNNNGRNNNIYIRTNNIVLSSTESKTNSKDDKASGSEKNKFRIPSYEEVQKYSKDNNLNFSIHDFLDYYGALDWKIDGSQVRSWKALAQCWDSNQFVYDTRTVGNYGYSFCNKLPEDIRNLIESDMMANSKGYIRSSTKKKIDDWIEGR